MASVNLLPCCPDLAVTEVAKNNDPEKEFHRGLPE